MFQFDIKAEDVNRYLSQALLDSTLGDKFKDAINRAIKDVFDSYNSPIKEMARNALRDHIMKILAEPEWQARMRSQLADKINEDFVSRMISRAVNSMQEDLKRLEDY